MATLIILVIYIVGVYMAYFQVQKWSDKEVTEKDEYQTLFFVSLLSWLIYPLYGIAWIVHRIREE